MESLVFVGGFWDLNVSTVKFCRLGYTKLSHKARARGNGYCAKLAEIPGNFRGHVQHNASGLRSSPPLLTQ